MPLKCSHGDLYLALSHHSFHAAVCVTVSLNREFFEDICVPSTKASHRVAMGTLKEGMISHVKMLSKMHTAKRLYSH